MLLLDLDQARVKTVVPVADVQKFYNDNIAQFQTPEQIRASHILLNTAGKDEAAVRKQAEELLQKIKAGADFAALAKQYSDDTGSKANGGDLDYFGRGRMVPEFETAAFALMPGQVSDVIKSQFGFHIIKVTDKKAAVTRPLEEVRAQIEDQLKAQRADQQIAAKAEELRAKISKPADLDTVAKDNGLKVTESDFFGREDSVPGLGAAPQVAASAFQLKDGEVSQALPSPRGSVFITVSGKKEPFTPALDQVKDKVRDDVTRTRAMELSRQKASSIAATLRSASDFAAAAKAQGFEAKPTELVARGTPLPDVGVNPAVESVAFKLPAGSVSDPITTKDATVIVRVAERDDVTPDKFKQGKDAFREELVEERRGRFFASYMAKAKERMKIQVNNDVVRRMLLTTT